MDMIELRRRVMLSMASGKLGIFKKLEVHEFEVAGITNPDRIRETTYFVIPHNLNEIPDFILIYPKDRLTPWNGTGSDVRVFQFAQYMQIGSSYIGNNVDYQNNTCILERLYTNLSGSKYQQFEYIPSLNIFSSITAESITFLGDTMKVNFGIRNGDYIALIGKIADAYAQGEQVIVNG